MNKNTLIFGVLGLVIIAGIAYMGFRSQPAAPAMQAAPSGASAMIGTDTTASGDAMMQHDSTTGSALVVDDNGVKTVTIDATNFQFSASEITVKKGDTVKIVFNNKQGFHDWVVDEFNAKTKQLKEGETETIEFTADTAGTFEYYCSVGKHRAMGMVGKLIVE